MTVKAPVRRIDGLVEFDIEAFAEAIDEERQRRGLHWNEPKSDDSGKPDGLSRRR